MKIRVRDGLWCIILLLGTRVIYTKNSNEITKVLHHKGSANTLEMGQIVFYFSKEPIIKQSIKTENNEKKVVTLVFPTTKVTDAALKMIEVFNHSPARGYYASIGVDRDKVSLNITYKPTKVKMEYVTCETIDNQRSIVFKFFNQEILDTIYKKQEAMLQTALLVKKPGIVIDCGHGGSDTGTMGYSGSVEKQVTLEVGLLLAHCLRDQGVEVFLTRDKDVTVALDERTSFANSCTSHMFLSIHANNASKSTVSGMEIFCLDDSLFKSCFSDVNRFDKSLIHSLMRERNKQSNVLARCLHTTIFNQLKKKYATLVDRKIKHSVTQTILGSCMPAVLVEIGFLSNPLEEKLLNTLAYKQDIAQALCQGVIAYIEKMMHQPEDNYC